MMLLKLLQSSDRNRFRHAVISLFGSGPIAERIRGLGVPLMEIAPDRSPGRLVGLPRIAPHVRRLRPQVVQGWMYHGNLFASLARPAARGTPAVLWNVRQTLYDLKREKPLTRLVIRAGAALSSRVDVVLYNSSLSREQHRRLGYEGRRNFILPNGFDLDVFAPDPAAGRLLRAELCIAATDLVIGNVARYHPMKDHASLLRAFAQLIEQRVSARLLLIGAGCDEGNEILRRDVSLLGLTPFVRLLGQRSDLPSCYAAMDVHCVSSAWGEGFPNAVGEAMACGVPNVVTDIGECRNIVGETGVVCAPGNHALLAGALCQLAHPTPEQRRTLGQAARQRISENYAMATVVKQYEAVYAEAAAAQTMSVGA